jgi:hypothetical protein
VEKNRSLNSTFSSGTMITSVRTGDRPSQAEPITFVPGPVLASGGQIDLTKSSNTEFHVTLYSALEQGDVEMSPGSSKVLNEEPIVS